MSAIVSAGFVTLCLAICAEAQIRTLALYAGNTGGLEAVSTQTLQQELRRLLAPAEVEPVWKELVQRKTGEDFEFVVVGWFDGSCSGAELPALPVSSAENLGSLADTSVSGGRVLPFFRVDCGRLVRMLAPALELLSAPLRHAIVGRALARVIAHEIYHILAKTTGHQDAGVAKPGFSLLDLTADRFNFDVWSLAQMRPMPSSVSETEATGR